METILKAPSQPGTPWNEGQSLSGFWQQYFKETPLCSREGCGNVALEVDPFFPYLDDRNRCGEHRGKGEHQPSLS